MSSDNGADAQGRQQDSSPRPEGRFPAPRPRASAPQGDDEATRAIPAARAQAPAPRPQPGAQPRSYPKASPTVGQQVARPQAGPRPAPGGQRPQPQLVRPTPKARVRKARLLISKVDPWSVLKMSFLLSVALGIMTVVCAVTLWTAMEFTGIFDRVNDLAEQVLGSEGGGAAFQVENLVTVAQVASFATIIAVVNVLLLTVLSTLAAILYNLSASLVGGIGVTLTDD